LFSFFLAFQCLIRIVFFFLKKSGLFLSLGQLLPLPAIFFGFGNDHVTTAGGQKCTAQWATGHWQMKNGHSNFRSLWSFRSSSSKSNSSNSSNINNAGSQEQHHGDSGNITGATSSWRGRSFAALPRAKLENM